MGPGQAALTSECDHTFHVRCVNGRAGCPACHARWSETPAVASAAAPANPFSFASPPAPSQPSATGLFGHVPPPPPATTNSFAFSSSPAFQTSVFGSSSAQTSSSPFSFNFPGAQTSSSQSFGGSLFGPQPPFCSVCSSFICRGQAAVTSECNHTFHLRCISGGTCPVCRAVWRDVVSMQLTPSPPFNAFSRPPQWSPFERHASSSFGTFNDDEPVEIPVDGRDNAVQEPGHNGVLVLKTHCEHPAVARDAAHENFVVMVNAKAPLAVAGAAARAPLDIVTVLDVSGSMSGHKLQLLKQAMGFVIDNLSSADRLSVVTFSTNARRITGLTRMSDAGKAIAKGAVESLYVESATNIGDGLRVAAEVLDGRRQRNSVASIILLSDGQDTFNFGDRINLVPHSLRIGAGNRGSPIHTFGFGMDHDAAAMHAIAEATSGTFSFIQNEAVVQDSFAQCIGGLLSVAVQEARLAVECLHPSVRIRAVKSGHYESSVGDDSRVASVYFGMMYAEEERRILLFLSVPVAAGDGGEDGGVTRLIKVSCNYRNAATRLLVNVAGEEEAVVQRPVVVAADTEPSVEVARERFRVEAAEDIAAAQAAAERGDHAEAARILDRRQEASAAAGLAGDARCAALVAELREMSARVASRREYEQTGRACLLAGISSHAQQRASTVQLFGSAVPGLGAPPSYGGGAGVGACAGFGGPSMFGAPAPGVSCPSPFGALPPIPSCGAPASSFVSGAPAPSFGSGFRTRAMEDMVELSRKRREQQGPFGPN
ncbi:hypothetical protein EJB05_16642, partial [Eragrostis curvula]